ncbi:mechanosensitive ion channel protein 10-like isoform X1 [Ananas comosus]|uniref:Mechanosensitive ion channel protein n=1 Tax=Ananas comosus TaxID=4615 RepID=A0A6P5EVA3_ANACO|nr:mechanosensitive ion channel protein 10-like isoform X1 [Ananas comosus]
MDDKEKRKEGVELNMPEKKAAGGSAAEVLITISSEGTPPEGSSNSKDPESFALKESGSPPVGGGIYVTRRGSKPHGIDTATMSEEENCFTEQEQLVTNAHCSDPLDKGSSDKLPASGSFVDYSQEGPEDDRDNAEETAEEIDLSEENRRGIRVKAIIKWVAFACNVGCFVASLTCKKLGRTMIWGFEFWRWSALLMVTFGTMLITHLFLHLFIFFIDRCFSLRRKIAYIVYGIKRSIQVFIWTVLVILAWAFLFRHGAERSKTDANILNYVTRNLISLLIGSFLWLLKSLWMRILASNFHVKAFFDRIQESLFQQYILEVLLGPPLMELAEKVTETPTEGASSLRSARKSKRTKDKKVINMRNLRRMNTQKVSTWTMMRLVDLVKTSVLSVATDTFDDDEGKEEITNELEATDAAYKIFRNVAKPDFKYIDKDDLLRFMIKEEVDHAILLIAGYETGQIDKKTLKEWVVKAYNDRKALACSLDDTSIVVKQLNQLVTWILVVVLINIWLLLMDLSSTQVILSQLLGAAFIFGNTCKNIFEGIIFVLAVHPFDVGDRCVVDGVVMLVEEVNIFTIVLLKTDNEKVYYPNSALATKPISNYNRSPDMGDKVEFSVDIATPPETIGLLKEKIKQYIEVKPNHWHSDPLIMVKEIEDENKLKMAVYCIHTMNFQDLRGKNKRRTELVMEMKKIFEELNVKYTLLR